ncbi:hypothetical protein MJO29_003463 [Puccinia striiformis f. sp. tritici]|nr:hypothetical protein MJO29_003463 [Puccinia striiformis f. sp. tritici]
MGVRHRARVRERDDQIGHRQEERVEDKKEPEESAPQQEVLDNETNEERNETHDVQKDLDAMDRVARLLVSDDKDDPNGDVEIEVEDLIDAHLEEILRQEDVRLFEGQTDEDENKNKNEIDPVERSRWFPFKNKMELVGSLSIGHTHSLVSRAIYNRNRAIMTVCDIQLPAWSTVRSARKRIRTFLKSQIKTETSPFGTPCFSLSIEGILFQDLANPLVSPHLEYYPEKTDGPYYKFSQSKKWLEELAPQHRAQMCEVDEEHYYLFEPVELASGLLVVPIFFYSQESEIYSKCIAPQIKGFMKDNKLVTKIKIPQDIKFDHPDLYTIHTSQFKKNYAKIQFNGYKLAEECADALYEHDGKGSQKKIQLPNPWRKKADGRIIRNVPITLYADDTSGNISKKFNKHISFYFTLSGLPPNLTNQEYNCHFLSTSNRATGLEIASQIVAEMNNITREGFIAFDSTSMKEVLVTGMVLCFLGDSPMHAEVTNTPNPGSSLNPCRMCHLKTETMDDKKSLDYIQQFLRINSDGSELTGNERNWSETVDRTYDLYCAEVEESHAEHLRRRQQYGLTDATNNRFLLDSKKNLRIRKLMEKLEEEAPEKLFNPFLELEGFDGVKDTPVEVLHVALLGFVKYLARNVGKSLKETEKAELIGRLQSFNTQGLNIPPINANGMVKHIKSLVGKDFKVLVQVAPFTFFKYLTPEHRAIWTALCKLVPFIFVTKINNMEEYQTQLKAQIQNFIYQCVKVTGQWVNKPKFHHLLHLPESILRFGPASLFSTEKFESFNGVMRNASIHSNRQSPGRDIAITFDNYYSLRFILSGGIIYNYSTKTFSKASEEVINIFQRNPVICKSLGYDFHASNPLSRNDYPFTKKDKVIEEEQLPVPQQLIDHCSCQNIKQVCQVQITKHEILEKGCFVSIQSHGSRRRIGSVQSLWEYHSRSRSKFYIHFNEFKIHEFNELYSMREVSRTRTKQYVNVNEIEACINVQHNCDKGNCPIKKTKPSRIERQETEIMTAQVEHSDNQHFVINTASFHDPFQHHIVSQTNLPQLSDADMVQCAVEGLENWGRNHFVFENPYAAADDNNDDGEEDDDTDNIN